MVVGHEVYVEEMAETGYVTWADPLAGMGVVETVEDRPGVAAATEKVPVHGHMAELGVDAEPENTAEVDEAEAGFVVEPESRTVAEPGLVVSVREPDYRVSSEAAVAWGCGVSTELVLEPRVGFVFDASEVEDIKAPYADTQVALDGVQLGPIAADPELLDKPELEELEQFAVGMLEEGPPPSAAARWADFVALVGESTVGMEIVPGGNLEGKDEAVLELGDAG